MEGKPTVPIPAPTLADVLVALTAMRQDIASVRQEVGEIKADYGGFQQEVLGVKGQIESVIEQVGALATRAMAPVTLEVPEVPPPNPDEVVTLVNRTPVPFEFMWDSIRYQVPALGRRILPRFKAEHARKHSAFALAIESEACDYKVGILDEHDTSPIPEDVLQAYRNELLAFPPGYAPRGIVPRVVNIRDEVLDRAAPLSNRAGVAAVVGASA